MLKLGKTDFLDWTDCLRLSNDKVELIISTKVGPRIISYKTYDGNNFFKVFEEQIASNDPRIWASYGGHRLWHAPEVFPRTYHPDNDPVEYDWDGKLLKLTCKTESSTGLQKEVDIKLAENGSEVKISQRIYNRNPWTVTFAPWSLTVMAPGGRAVIPQEPFVPHGESEGESFEPARSLVLWQFTRMNDPRFIWGDHYIQFVEDSRYDSKQKFGVTNKQGWGAYTLNGQTFIKQHDYESDAVYPDNGCNAEFFTMPGFLEMEALGRLKEVKPDNFAQLNESWSIHDIALSEKEEEINIQLKGVI